MKKLMIFLCIVLLATQAIAFGQKTEVSVTKGKVVAKTTVGQVTIDAGRKAILTEDANVTVTVDDPIVDDIMKMYIWLEEERVANGINIDFTSIQVASIESEEFAKGAFFFEMPNMKSEPTNMLRIGSTTLLDNPKFYDLQGNLLPFDVDKVNEQKGYYYLHFLEAVEPGENFECIGVGGKKVSGGDSLWRDSRLWHFRAGNCTPNCLNYYRIILPKSAIFVKSSRPVAMVDSFDGRVAVTIRNYTGVEKDGMYQISFLWPEKDGTTLADLPPNYRGLIEDITEEGIIRTTQIIEKSPLETLPWDNAGKEALDVYQHFVDRSVEYIEPWLKLGIKLVGGGYWEQAFDCFERCEKIHTFEDSEYYIISLVWQGHIYDIKGRRQKALEKYNRALEVVNKYEEYASAKGIEIEKRIFIRHDQWGIVLDFNWIQRRLEKPFTKEMIGK